MKKPPSPHDNQDMLRLFSALMMVMLILFLYQTFVMKPKAEQAAQKAAATATTVAQKPATAAPVPSGDRPRAEVIAAVKRIPILGTKISGSLSLTGARIDDLHLDDRFTHIDRKERIALLSPSGTKEAYYAESGWVSEDPALTVPNDKTVWHLAAGSAAELKAGGSVTLEWDNGHGFLFTRTVALDDNYLFTVTQKVTNKTETAKRLSAWSLVSRHSKPADFSGFFILHEGPLTYLNGELKEQSYKELDKGENVTKDGVQGWLGITDKYWFVGLFPAPGKTFDARVVGHGSGDSHTYQTDITSTAQDVAPGQTIESTDYVFAGVKNLPLLNSYHEKYGFKRPDLAFDFGMWFFITKPFYLLLHFLMHTLGNVGLAILAMTVIIRAVMFPLASKSFRAMAKMKKVAPQLKELQEKHGNNREQLQLAIFELYKKENVNPFSGCWPMLVQIPIFFALYKSILLSVELRHAPFWGWIHDLSAPDPTNLFTLFGLINWTPPSLLHLGAWPILFCLTMIVQQRLAPPMPDKTQEQLQQWFPYIITFMLAKFAAGLVIYWTWSNTLGVLQQYYILRTLGEQDVSLLRGHSERRKKKKKTNG